jgi:YHS domain-containing protein
MKIIHIASIAVATVIGFSPLGLLSNSPVAQAKPPITTLTENRIPDIYTDPKAGNNLAIRGYDPVAYFTEGKPVKGKASFEYPWKGAIWRFSSAKNQNQFQKNPNAFAPQYGGYCAKALSEGNLASSVPDAWTIVDGKLYLNYSQEVQKQWLQDVTGNIKLANNNWPRILKTATVVYYDTVGGINY